MDKRLAKCLMTCIKTMRKYPKSNYVLGLNSNYNYNDPVHLDIFRIGPNDYTLYCDSPIKEECWKHEGLNLRMLHYAVNTWYEYLDDIDKYKHFEY